MKINRNGVTRIVIEFSSVVVKIPNFLYSWRNFLRGLIGNMDENYTWKWNSGKYEKGNSYLLCPVLWCSWGGWILIMKKAYVPSQKEWDEMEYYNTEHRKHFPGDDTISNYGILDNRLVKIDYASLSENWIQTLNSEET